MNYAGVPEKGTGGGGGGAQGFHSSLACPHLTLPPPTPSTLVLLHSCARPWAVGHGPGWGKGSGPEEIPSDDEMGTGYACLYRRRFPVAYLRGKV